MRDTPGRGASGAGRRGRGAGDAGSVTAAGITVRAGTPDDIEVVMELRLALLREHASNPIYSRVRADVRARARRLYSAQLASPNEVTLLAQRGDAVVGVLRCVENLGYPLLEPPVYGYISSVYVRDSARRAGVLRILLDAAVAWCRDRDITEMRLHNAVDNPASNAAWDALGFEVVEHLRMRRVD